MRRRNTSSLIVKIVVFLQGLLTFLLLISGLGVGFSVPKPIPFVLALALLSGGTFIGLIFRQWWAAIPAAILIAALLVSVIVLTGVAKSWMPGVGSFLLIFFGLVMLVPAASIIVSIATIKKTKSQTKEKGDAQKETPTPNGQ